MTENTRILENYRLEQAVESLEAARVLLEKDLLRPSLNRSYQQAPILPHNPSIAHQS
jgi:hypothetical protein